MSPEQAIVAEGLRKNPAPSLLDAPATAQVSNPHFQEPPR
jgi:hypothetical protein